MHKLDGSYPANFQLQTTPCRGVGKDCGDSLAIVGEVLYYRGVHGFCAYDGSLPRSVSQALGAMPCCRTVAGAWGSKYVVSQEGADGWEMLVLDTGRMLWHREDGFHADAIAPCGRECYAIDHDSGTIVTLGGSGEPLEEEVCWSAQTGKLGLGTPEQKYVSRLTLRLAARPGAKVRLLVRYDGCDRWQEMACLEPKSTGSFSVPFVPRRCDWLELRLEGRGDVQLYSLTRTMEKGSELP